MPWVGKSMDRKRSRRLVQEQMFAPPPKQPRAKPRVMMHWDDAGVDKGGHFVCARCKYHSWYFDCSAADFKRGIPCPTCNTSSEGTT